LRLASLLNEDDKLTGKAVCMERDAYGTCNYTFNSNDNSSISSHRKAHQKPKQCSDCNTKVTGFEIKHMRSGSKCKTCGGKNKETSHLDNRSSKTCDSCGAEFDYPMFTRPCKALDYHKTKHKKVENELSVSKI